MAKTFRDKIKHFKKQLGEDETPKTIVKKKKLPKHKLKELTPEEAQDFVEDFE